MRTSLRRVVATAGVALAGITVSPVMSQAEASRGVAVGTRLAARSDPAVQLIQTDYSATVIVPAPRANKYFTALFTKAARHAKAGRIPADHQSQVKWVLRTAASNVGRYLTPVTPNRSVKVGAPSLCTGWWVTPDGYMVTGAHCVGSTKAVLRQRFAANVLPAITTKEVQGFLKSISKVAQPDDELIRLATTMFGRFNGQKMRVTGLRRSIVVVSPLPGGGMDKTAKITPLTLVAKGRDYPGEDFALLKMAGGRNLPTLALGRDTDVRVGDPLYINGFPGLVTTSADIFDLRSRLYPALTEGAYNARRTTVLGVPYIQAQAPSYHGNSGGPVLDEEGRVIGTLIAGSVDRTTGETAENHSFILPVGIIRKRLAAARVTPSASPTSRLYNAALDDFFADRYKAALPRFRQVLKLYPAHPYVASYIQDAKRAIAAGKDRTPRT
ncbi:trypsin-like peptidase domain-containing protein [Sphaerisporangium perillae]|uniref:trypsin-like peptidase domain-containing protein n=1 Tax=Sphaerisporangium perillae TaxID=2935860 RepID=UPI002010306A|nr:trypsin-like peptidase domain-containing protein [Sphaerisporangium perillae]